MGRKTNITIAQPERGEISAGGITASNGPPGTNTPELWHLDGSTNQRATGFMPVGGSQTDARRNRNHKDKTTQRAPTGRNPLSPVRGTVLRREPKSRLVVPTLSGISASMPKSRRHAEAADRALGSVGAQSSYGANEFICCDHPDNNRVSRDIGTSPNAPETELYCARNRTYSPRERDGVLRPQPKSRLSAGAADREIQRDPTGYADETRSVDNESGQALGGINLYEYVGGRVEVGVDPTGEICEVTFLCRLASSGIDRRNPGIRNCHYQCTEVGFPKDRIEVGYRLTSSTGLACAALPNHPLAKLVDSTESSPWGLWLIHCGAPPPCRPAYITAGAVTRAKLGNCSRASWRKACQEVEDAADKACDAIPNKPSAAGCKAAATLAFVTRVSIGNAICKNP